LRIYRFLKRIRKKLGATCKQRRNTTVLLHYAKSAKDNSPQDDEVWQMIGRPLEMFELKAMW